MGNIYSSHEIQEYQKKIESLEKRVLELEQKVFLGYDVVNGKLIIHNESKENDSLITNSIRIKRK